MITFTGYKLSKLQKDIIAEAVGSALDVLEEDSEEDQARIFEDYINGGLKKISLWDENMPGKLLDSILIGLQEENLLKINEEQNDDDVDF